MQFLLKSLFAALVCCLFARASAAEPVSPNFVVIFIDDMGYGDIEPFGSKLNRTPNLNRMAEEGMKLTSFYAAPVCSASRAQLLTGCYAPRVSVPGVFFPAGSRGLNPEEETVADYLKALGYATMCVGKWHLGDQREFLPTRQGFDGYFGIPYSNDMGRPSLEDGRSVHPLMRDEKVAELLENEGQRRITREYTEEAVRFIEKNQRDRFFLYLPHTAMHVPLFPHQDFVGKSKNGTYGDWVEEVDWSVGQVLDTLRRLKLESNTLVLFTTDNGPWASKGDAGGVSGPLRGSKGCTLEGGVRVPTIAWWPGRIKAGSQNDGVAGTTDVLPTFVKLAGGELRGNVRIDGVDLAPVLLGEAEQSARDAWFYYQGTNLKAVRCGPWKLAVAPQSPGMGIRERAADLLTSGPRLYNLDEEIGEITDVAAKNPKVVERLLKKIDEMKADIGSGKAGPGVRPAGIVENPVTLYPTRPRGRRRPPGSGLRKPIVWDRVKAGEVYSSSSAPQIARNGFVVLAEIDGDRADGVLVAHGGSSVGYSLYTKASRAVFALRVSSSTVHRVSVKLPEEKQLKLKLQAQVSAEGMLSLKVNDGEPVTRKAALIPDHPQEDLGIGVDDGNPVDEEAPRGRYRGRIHRVNVALLPGV